MSAKIRCRTRLYLSLTFIAGIAVSCKPQAGSNDASVKTLDNYTRADGASITNYFCGLSMTGPLYQQLSASDRHIIDSRIIVQGNDAALKYAAAGALAAVPKAMQQVFFAGQGKIRIVDDAQAACNSVNLTEPEKAFASENAKDVGGSFSFDGCWQIEGGKVDIILTKDKAVIHHGLLRLFTYVYTQVFVRGVATLPALADGVARFKHQRYTLGVALLQDLYAASPETAKTYEGFATADREAYENAAFSEAVDSHYCSATTRAVFEKRFPKTYAAFTGGSDSIAKDFGEPLY